MASPCYDLLRRIPTSLSGSILHKWIDIKTLKAFDSAYCNASSRSELSELIRSEEIILYERIIRKCKERVELITSRSLEPRVLLLGVIGVGDDEDLALSYVQRFAHKVGILLTHGPCTPYIAEIATQCHHLTYLELGNAHLNEVMLRDMLLNNSHLVDLRILTETSPDPPSFKNVHLPHLTSLTVWYSSNMIVDLLKATKGVRTLNLSHIVLPNAELREIAMLCPDLQALGLSDIGIEVTNETLAFVALMCPKIVHLDVSDNARLTDEALAGALRNLKCVRSLSIQRCYSLTDETLEYLSTNCADTLHTLYLNASDDGPAFGYDKLNTLFEQCTHIRTLGWLQYTAGQCTPYTFTPAIRNITTLVLQQDSLTDANLIAIATYCVNMKRLSIVHSDSADNILFTRAGLKALVFGCNNLQEVALNTFVDNFYSSESIPHPGLELAVDLWKHLRPQLLVRETSSPLDSFRFDVRCLPLQK